MTFSLTGRKRPKYIKFSENSACLTATLKSLVCFLYGQAQFTYSEYRFS